LFHVRLPQNVIEKQLVWYNSFNRPRILGVRNQL